MGIADIFEALTAGDRPYKGAMTLSQALAILAKFRENGHIDPDLHDVFVNNSHTSSTPRPTSRRIRSIAEGQSTTRISRVPS
jgi:HD-GYP domain-containing protein (c-di-GMP phosphodiesterase class II)